MSIHKRTGTVSCPYILVNIIDKVLKKPVFLLIVLTVLLSVSLLSGETAVIVAKVGDEVITANQLSEKIVIISEEEEYAELSFLQRRELALKELIEEALLFNYARDKGIRVTTGEIDDYFRVLYGDHDRVTTNGVFDNQKYRQLKNLPEIRNLLNNLRRELLIDKAQSIIRSQFRFTDQELLNRYYTENTEVDLCYVLLPQEKVAVPFLASPAEAYSFYAENRHRYPQVKTLEIEFFVVPFKSESEKRSETKITSEDVSGFINNASKDVLIAVYNEVKPPTPKDLRYIGNLQEIRSIVSGQDSTSLQRVIGNIIIREKTESSTLQQAATASARMRNGLNIEYPVISLKLYDSETKAGSGEIRLDTLNPALFRRETLLPHISRLNRGQLSEPLKTPSGYLVVRLHDVERPEMHLPYPLARQVWKDFVYEREMNARVVELRDFYRSIINELYVPAVYITRLTIDREILNNTPVTENDLYIFFQNNKNLIPITDNKLFFEDLQEEIREAYIKQRLTELKKWCRANIYKAGDDLAEAAFRQQHPAVSGSNEIVYLRQFPNGDEVSERIKNNIGSLLESNPAMFREVNEFDTGGKSVFYVINSWYPRHLPSPEEVMTYLHRRFTEEVMTEEDDYLKFYEASKNHFTTPDSISLAGLFYPTEPHTVSISDRELRDFFNERQGHLFTEHRIVLEYIKISDPDIIKRELVGNVAEQLAKGTSFSLLQELFGSREELFPVQESFGGFPSPAGNRQFTTIPLSRIPLAMREHLDNLAAEQTGNPVYYEGNWYIFRKIREIAPQPASFNDIRAVLSEELRKQKAEAIALSKAQEAFVEMTGIRDIRNYPDSTILFATQLQSVTSGFEPLGDISAYRARLYSLRPNERLNTIFSNERGYGVVFVTGKRSGAELNFRSALPMVVEYYHSQRLSENAQQYARYLRDLCVNGEDPEKLFAFFGGWHREENLRLNDLIPGVQYSSLILESAVNRNVGEYSHVIRNSADELLLYRLDRKKSVSREAYRQERESFQSKVIRDEFEKYLHQYGLKFQIEKF